MAKVKVEVVGAYVDGNAPGTTISIEKNSADHLETIGYVRKVKTTSAAKPRKKAVEKEDEEK